MNNIIEEKRESIENTSSNRELLDILENLLPTIDSLVFKEPMHGDVDFSVLTECGFNNITSIVFEAGDVTNIRNLPGQITRLHIAGNLLTHLEDLPESLSDLNAANNGIKQLDVSALKNLKSLNVSDNELVELVLPASIESLLCQNNKLVELNLDGLDSLKTLNCNGNPLLSITHFQDTIENFVMENNPAVEIRRDMDKDDEDSQQNTNVEVRIALKKYFELKREYDDNLLEKKRSVYEKEKAKKTSVKKRREILENVKVPCVYCSRLVNNIFTCSQRTYTAKCGDKQNPCNFHIEIYTGKYMDLNNMLHFLKNTVEEERENIIKIKMNSLLNYQNEKKAVKEFKDNIEEYNEISDYLQIVTRDYEELYFNKETDMKIKQKKDNIFELQERMRKMLEEYKIADSSNRESIKDIMTFYKDELMPQYHNLQEMKYPFKDVKIVRKYPKMEEYPMYFIIQKPISFNKIDYSYGKEEPRVIAYIH